MWPMWAVQERGRGGTGGLVHVVLSREQAATAGIDLAQAVVGALGDIEVLAVRSEASGALAPARVLIVVGTKVLANLALRLARCRNNVHTTTRHDSRVAAGKLRRCHHRVGREPFRLDEKNRVEVPCACELQPAPLLIGPRPSSTPNQVTAFDPQPYL